MSEILRRRYRYRQATGIAFAVVITVLAVQWETPMKQWVITGAVFAVLGMIIRMWASGHVKKDKVLAITGPYAYVRHPLYVGNHLIAIGMCLASGLLWSLPAYLVLALFFYPSTIRREDSRLRKFFPDQWDPWKATTHALIPRSRPHKTDQVGEWSFKQSLMANGEPLYVIGITVGLVYMWMYAH